MNVHEGNAMIGFRPDGARIELVKDCECPVPASGPVAASGQSWIEMHPAGDQVVLVSHFQPELACTTCHRPWRAIARDRAGRFSSVLS
jgi:hypothetical protein